MTYTIEIRGRSDPARAQSVLQSELRFGQQFADLMICVQHDDTRGWHDAELVPYGPLAMSPAAKSLHYGLEIFEGLKAYRQANGEVALFRPEQNARRLNISAERLAMPTVPESLQLDAMATLVDRVRAWVPEVTAGTLYLRPALIGTEPALGVNPSRAHLYFVIASPTGAYFKNGFATISARVEARQSRAVLGGVGYAKAGGNYAASMKAKQRAKAEGFDEVIWLDAATHRHLEELSAMNVCIVREGVLVTPPVSETILDGITRRSVVAFAARLGVSVAEAPIAIDALMDDIEAGAVTEMMALGTAAVVTPIGEISYNGRRAIVANGTPGPLTERIYHTLTGIQHGRIRDDLGWMRVVAPAA